MTEADKEGNSNCYTCDTDCTRSRCDFIGSSSVSVMSDGQLGGFTDGVFTNTTVVVKGGYITNVYSGKPFEYNTPVCGGAAGGTGGGGVSNTIIINQDPKNGQAGAIENISARNIPYGQPINVENKGTPEKADLLFSFPEQKPIDPTTVLNSVVGSNNVVTVSNGLVTEVASGATFITSANLIVSGGAIAGSANLDPVNKGFLHIGIDVTNLDTRLTTFDQTLTQQQGSISTLEDRIAVLEKSTT